jgi:hypothetical protein
VKKDPSTSGEGFLNVSPQQVTSIHRRRRRSRRRR